MSLVTLILVKNKTLRLFQAHYKTIKIILEKEEFDCDVIKQKLNELDAGYIFLDYDHHLLLNAQTAFALTNLLEEFENVCV